MQERLDIIAVHFHQLPLVDEKEIEKVKDLVKALKVRKLYLVPFTPVLKMLVEKCNHRNYYILSKIAMFQAAEVIAEKENAKFLITGENLAQVSSQTLSNLTTITKNIKLEIFRPVLAYDKQDIIKIAEKIKTYEISKGPEICSLLGPKYPNTKSNPAEIAKEIEKWDKELIKKQLAMAEIISVEK